MTILGLIRLEMDKGTQIMLAILINSYYKRRPLGY